MQESLLHLSFLPTCTYTLHYSSESFSLAAVADSGWEWEGWERLQPSTELRTATQCQTLWPPAATFKLSVHDDARKVFFTLIFRQFFKRSASWQTSWNAAFFFNPC